MTTPLSASLLLESSTLRAVAYSLGGYPLPDYEHDAAIIMDAIMEQYGGQMPPQDILMTTEKYAVNWACGGWPENLMYWTNRENNANLHRTTFVGLVYMLLYRLDLLPPCPWYTLGGERRP